jgi:hypothetical protein
MRRILLAAVALLVAAAPADAGCQGSNFIFCSKNFFARAVCDGKDQLAAISDNHCPAGQTCAHCPSGKDCPLIQPWEPVPIEIRGVEIALSWGALNYAFAGNNYQPDVMAFMGAGQTHRQQWFPEGLSFTMPATGSVGGSPHIDLHVSCPKASAKRCVFCWKRKPPAPNVVLLHYTIYYTVPGLPPRLQ